MGGARGRKSHSLFSPSPPRPLSLSRALRQLRKQLLHHLAADVGQPEVAALEAIGQLEMVEAEQVQDRGLQVVDVDSVLDV